MKRREELETEFVNGRMEGQSQKPKHFWCENCEGGGFVYKRHAEQRVKTNCPKCGGTGVVERE